MLILGFIVFNIYVNHLRYILQKTSYTYEEERDLRFAVIAMSITVPEGLSDLLQDFAIVVLREKPKDLVEFAANYFTDLHERSKSGKTETPGEDADKQKSPERNINVVIAEESVEMQDEGTICAIQK